LPRTARHEIDHAFKGYENGAVDFLYKPLDSFAVRGKVDVFVDLHRQREQTRRQLAALEQSRLEQQALQAELERALRMRDDFMSLVAHELRTPLSVLALGLQVRQKQLEKGNAEFFAAPQLAAMLTKDLRQVHSMTRLIEDMLDVSRIRNGKLSIRPAQTDLSALLQRLVDDFAVHDKGRSISLAAEPGIVGWWDEFRIEQVVVNLLTNALRYGASRPIEVRLGASAGDACLVVRDHGIGIAPEAQQRIFEQFVRVADRSVPSGLGLGLFITRQLVEAHGGTIGVESRPGDGAAFTVRLPLAGRRVEPVLTPGPNAEGSIATSGTP
jgi:signal transduction histidine kinase